MTEETKWLARYAMVALAIIGGLEWLLGRTVSRLGAAPMLEGTPRDIIQGFAGVGLFLVSPSLLLALLLVVLAALQIARDALRERRLLESLFAFFLPLFAVVVAAHTIFATQRWL